MNPCPVDRLNATPPKYWHTTSVYIQTIAWGGRSWPLHSSQIFRTNNALFHPLWARGRKGFGVYPGLGCGEEKGTVELYRRAWVKVRPYPSIGTRNNEKPLTHSLMS